MFHQLQCWTRASAGLIKDANKAKTPNSEKTILFKKNLQLERCFLDQLLYITADSEKYQTVTFNRTEIRARPSHA